MLDKCLCLPLPFIFTSYIRKFFLYEICFLMFGVLQNKLYLCILLKSFKCHDAIEIFRAALMGSRRRQWHPTPLLLPGKSHGGRSLVSCGPWGRSVRHDTGSFSLGIFQNAQCFGWVMSYSHTFY